MREAREAAIAASEARVNFVARMSHEMRTPLTAILGFVGIARDEHSSASDLREALDAIHRNAGQLYGLVDDVLGFSQVEGGQLQLQARECRPSEIVSSVVESNSAQATAKTASNFIFVPSSEKSAAFCLSQTGCRDCSRWERKKPSTTPSGYVRHLCPPSPTGRNRRENLTSG